MTPPKPEIIHVADCFYYRLYPGIDVCFIVFRADCSFFDDNDGHGDSHPSGGVAPSVLN